MTNDPHEATRLVSILHSEEEWMEGAMLVNCLQTSLCAVEFVDGTQGFGARVTTASREAGTDERHLTRTFYDADAVVALVQSIRGQLEYLAAESPDNGEAVHAFIAELFGDRP